jgi:Alpha amylase, C-terminal all-beta domain
MNDDDALDFDAAQALASGRHGAPFSVLGPHRKTEGTVVRVYLPGACGVEVIARAGSRSLGALAPGKAKGIFEGPASSVESYRLRISWPGALQETEDPYAFGLLLSDYDLHLIGEGRHDRELHWGLTADPLHDGMRRLVRDLNLIYAHEPALHAQDAEPEGFAWLIGDDRANSVFAFLRVGTVKANPVLVVSNMTPEPRWNYRIGVPMSGHWREILNTDSGFYGGSNVGNGGVVETAPIPAHGRSQSVELVLPPLATLFLRCEN